LPLRLAAPKSYSQHQEQGYALTNLPDPGKVVPDKRGCGLWATKRVVGDKPSSVHEPIEDFLCLHILMRLASPGASCSWAHLQVAPAW
jgi:hypothetical protein